MKFSNFGTSFGRFAAVLLWLVVVGGCHEDESESPATCGDVQGGDVSCASGDVILGGDGIIFVSSDADENDEVDEDECEAQCLTTGEGGECLPNPCLIMDEVAGTCAATYQPCDDGDPCTDIDRCRENGNCAGSAIFCANDQQCLDSYCEPGIGCITDPAQGPCDDGDACTIGDICAAETCSPGLDALACNDNNACTTDSCKPVNGCEFETGVDCDDQNPCTTDSCNPTSGQCSNMPNALLCQDGDACTENDQCSGGQCEAGFPLLCNDQNPCTLDQCSSITGCNFSDFLPGICNDGNSETVGDTCQFGECKGELASCDDGDPCTKDTGIPGNQCAHSPVDCNDGKECTTDSCEGLGCVNAPHAGACDDGSACTSGDMCTDDVCVGVVDETACNDNNPCTTDGCEAAGGCNHSDIPGCEVVGEKCGDGVDNDADGATDCADSTECLGSAPAYVIHAQTMPDQEGKMTFLAPGILAPTVYDIPSGSPHWSYTVYCVEVQEGPLTMLFQTSGGTLAVWTQKDGGGAAPPSWDFFVWDNWVGDAVLEPQSQPDFGPTGLYESADPGGPSAILISWDPPQ
ncbi:MAG: hypothetical protein AAB373_00905 [Patescibacteria group bacterium]